MDYGLRTMRNIKLTLSYDGTDFNGWQSQPGFRTVQETLEGAIAGLTGDRVRVNASGRTDTGVHAVGQVANCVNAGVRPAASVDAHSIPCQPGDGTFQRLLHGAETRLRLPAVEVGAIIGQ